MTATGHDDAVMRGPGEAAVPRSLRALLGGLDDAGIGWSLLRPVASLAAQGDVDLLVAPGDVSRVEALLDARGFVLMPLPPPDVHGVVYDDEAGRFVWVHVQGALRLAGATVPAEDVLAASVAEEGARRPGDAWLLWILLLRALVDTGRLPERYRAAAAALAARWDGGATPLVALARSRGVEPERAVERAAAADWAGLLALSVHRPAARRPLGRRVAGRLRRLRAGRGISVAVVGPDGAGKTSLAEALGRDLPLPALVQYMGLTGGSMPRADRLRIPGLVLSARLGLIWLRYWRGVRHTLRGGIVVFERYPLDGYVPSGTPLGPGARVSRRVQRRACPLPDLVLLLDAPGQTLHARSGEYDTETLERWRALFAALESRVPQLVKLDAERPADEVRREAEAAVWRRYGELRGRRPVAG